MQKYQKPLEQALQMLQKEDPSLKVSSDSETGQTIISGMGELHLEVVLERIRTDFKVDAYLGPFQVAYKETASSDAQDTFVLDKTVGMNYTKAGNFPQPEHLPCIKLHSNYLTFCVS